MHLVGMQQLDQQWFRQTEAAYDAAMAQGLWNGSYSDTNFKEYWAEGVQVG
jgi:hypothetical protein